jgi:exopolysaccharide biosynthesis protein
MIRNGIVYYDRAETTSYAILPDGTLKIYGQGETNAEQLQALGVKDSFSFGPILVKDGQLAYDDGGKPGTITMRVAFGYSDPYHYIVPITMRDRIVQMSYGMIAKVCMRYGCRAAYNLDGGHSTSLVFMGQELSLLTLTDTPHGNIRGLSDIVIFLENDAVQPKDSDLK